MLIACHCEGKGWKYWGDTNLSSKFRGRSIQLDPIGVLTLEFDDGEVFQWRKVTTTVYNIIFCRIYCDHHGTMSIRGNRRYSCNLKFKEQALLDRNPRQVHGHVEEANGAKVANLFGKWDDCMYYAKDHTIVTDKALNKSENHLLWKKNQPPSDPTRYNLSSFAISLNELTPGLEESFHLPIQGFGQTRGILRTENMKKQTLKSFAWRKGSECPVNCKRMVGSQDGSRKTQKTPHIVILVDIGKKESRRNGMNVQIFLASFHRLLKLLAMALVAKDEMVYLASYLSSSPPIFKQERQL